MFFDYMGYGGCYRGISVDPRYRQDSRPNNDCRDERPGCGRFDNDSGRFDNDRDDRCFGNECSNSRSGGDPCSDNRSDNDRCHNNGSCNESSDNNNCCENENCCAEGVMAVLSIATRTLGRNDTVDVEITVEGGYTQVVALGRGTSTIISSDILRTPQGAISLCDITRIRILSSSVSDPEYMQRLLNELQRFIGRPMRDLHVPGCSDGDCDSCVEAMQRYIMRNSEDIDALLLDGSQPDTASVVTGTVTTPVIAAASLDPITASFVTAAELTTDTVEAVTAVTAADIEVVTAIELLPASLVSEVAVTTAEVSAPVTVTEVEAAGTVAITESGEFASGVTVTDTTVVGSVSTDTVDVISGFSEPETITGVISGVESVEVVDTTAVNVPIFSSSGTGALRVVVPAGAFGTNIPAAAVTLNVTVDGVGISYGGFDTVYALLDDTRLLSGITGDPAVSDIELPGTPVTAVVVSEVTSTEATVVESVGFEAVAGSLVTDVTTVTVGSAEQPDTVEVVSSITSETTDINGVATVSTVEASGLFTTDTAAVLSDAQLDVTSTDGLSSVELVTTSVNVISGITTTPVSVASPTFAEPIEGEIVGARRGIIAVDNTDGDISVYSSCAIRGAQLETDPQA